MRERESARERRDAQEGAHCIGEKREKVESGIDIQERGKKRWIGRERKRVRERSTN